MPTWDLDAVFNEAYLQFYEKAHAPDRTTSQCDLIAWLLAPPPGGYLLDICCGHGRHAHELAHRGYRVLGIDRSPFFLRKAKHEAPSRAYFVLAYAQTIPTRDGWADGAYCFFSSIGYGSEEEDLQLFKAAARSIRPDSRFLVETLSGNDIRRLKEPAVFVTETSAGRMIDRIRYGSTEKRFYNTRTYEVIGQPSQTVEYHVRIYYKEELIELFKLADLRDIQVYSEKSTPYTEAASRMIVVGVR